MRADGIPPPPQVQCLRGLHIDLCPPQTPILRIKTEVTHTLHARSGRTPQGPFLCCSPSLLSHLWPHGAGATDSRIPGSGMDIFRLHTHHRDTQHTARAYSSWHRLLSYFGKEVTAKNGRVARTRWPRATANAPQR